MWTKFMIKLRARGQKEGSVSQQYPALITDSRTEKKASSQMEITNRKKKKKLLLLRLKKRNKDRKRDINYSAT